MDTIPCGENYYLYLKISNTDSVQFANQGSDNDYKYTKAVTLNGSSGEEGPIVCSDANFRSGFSFRSFGSDGTYVIVKFSIDPLNPQISDFTFTAPSDLTYDGNVKTATITTSKAGMGAITLEYRDADGNRVAEARNAGKYYVVVKIANGTKYKSSNLYDWTNWTFTITKADQSLLFANASVEADVNDKTYTQTATGAQTAVTYSSSDPSVASVNPTTGKVTLKTAGTVTIKAKAKEGENYKAATASYTLTITGKTKEKEKVEEKAEADTADNLDRVLREAAENGGKQTVKWYEGNSLPISTMMILKDNPELTLEYSYYYMGKHYSVTIPGSAAIVDKNILWYGPLWLAQHYSGQTAAVTATTNDLTRQYVVQKNDTLSYIAKKVGVSIEEILKLNPEITNRDLIYENQVIKY